mgnify:CR=1 FL=1
MDKDSRGFEDNANQQEGYNSGTIFSNSSHGWFLMGHVSAYKDTKDQHILQSRN